jgi:iron complex outermembrane receptor protein
LKTGIFCALLLVLTAGAALQAAEITPAPAAVDTPLYVNPFEYTVTAPRLEIPLRQSPAATTVVGAEALQTLPRGVSADEALKIVPGVRVDNNADGSRVHLSIRGQGILVERGIRGIKLLLDGLPLNDPSGTAPDLYDVDWATVGRVEVLRGPATSLYGGGGAGGVMAITTQDGGAAPVGGEVWTTAGSHGLLKTLGQLGGTEGDVNYRVSASRMTSDGYRVHTAARADNFYGKLHWNPSPRDSRLDRLQGRERRRLEQRSGG